MDSFGKDVPFSGHPESGRRTAPESPEDRAGRAGEQAGRDERYGPVEERYEPAEECFGPLRLARHVKRDGRALILFTREEAREA